MPHILRQKTTLLRVGEAQDLCFIYTSRRRRLRLSSSQLPFGLSLVALTLSRMGEGQKGPLPVFHCKFYKRRY